MKKRGFTLIELAIVLTIIGLMVGGSFKMLKMMRERAKTQEAKEQVQAAKNAVLGYALEYVDLPSSSEFATALSPSQDESHPIFYVVDSVLSNDDDICAYDKTDLTLKVDTDPSSADGNISVAFVVAHEGANYNLQTGVTGSNTVNIYTPSTLADDNTTYMNNASHEYDDIVEWVTLNQLKDEIGCIDKPFRFINDKLPNALQYRDYNATLYVENNVLPNVVITCNPMTSEKGLSFSGTTFSGVPDESGVVQYDCNATVTGSNQKVQKSFVITIEPNLKDYSEQCTQDSECESGICVDGNCTTGGFGASCDDGSDCKSAICYGGICSGAIGDPCDNNNSQCLSGYCKSGVCAIIQNETNTSGGGSSGGGVGSPCTSDDDCDSGLKCLNSGGQPQGSNRTCKNP